MTRLEITANSTIREDILEALKSEGIPAEYTWIPGVLGEGTSGPREGSTVWPDHNILLILYLEEDQVRNAREAITLIKKRFPGEGLRGWITPADRIL